MAEFKPGSLADQAIAALAAVACMDDGLEIEHEERHQVRTLKRLAQKRLEEAFGAAQELAWLAEDVRKTAREAARGANA